MLQHTLALRQTMSIWRMAAASNLMPISSAIVAASLDVFTAYAVEGIFFRMITKLPATGLLFPIAGSYGIMASDTIPSPTVRPILWIWKKAYQKKMRKGRTC